MQWQNKIIWWNTYYDVKFNADNVEFTCITFIKLHCRSILSLEIKVTKVNIIHMKSTILEMM